ncbi:uncharacterized protein LOC117793251 [Drosophila innubila]|uniref:uncharacterized protein LOC117793251 n=1 Tax=Drosophila innubila TaxID=198719 RepID=UPI00148C55B7|nr:uncharacterized protein LOC117793251 [Drosophila innubila]
MSGRADVTPQPRRRLGLRLPKGATTPGLRRLEPLSTPLTEENNRKRETDAVETPRACSLKPKANSTNCRRLGLSRRRTDLSKKRLEFITSSDKVEDAATPEDPTKPQKSEWRQRKILELEADIETWKNGFIAAMSDLQALAPTVPKETLLIQLKIPLEMLKYLDED